MTVCPKKVKSVAVSTTIRPVTHTALVAVKKASVKLMEPGVAAGSSSSSAPTTMMPAKLPTKRLAGWICWANKIWVLNDARWMKYSAMPAR